MSAPTLFAADVVDGRDVLTGVGLLLGPQNNGDTVVSIFLYPSSQEPIAAGYPKFGDQTMELVSSIADSTANGTWYVYSVVLSDITAYQAYDLTIPDVTFYGPMCVIGFLGTHTITADWSLNTYSGMDWYLDESVDFLADTKTADTVIYLLGGATWSSTQPSFIAPSGVMLIDNWSHAFNGWQAAALYSDLNPQNPATAKTFIFDGENDAEVKWPNPVTGVRVFLTFDATIKTTPGAPKLRLEKVQITELPYQVHTRMV
jgi:hypothetical protein